MKLVINSISDLQNLNICLMSCSKQVDARQMHYVVNAKSLMGCFSLDWTTGVEVVTYCDRDFDILADFVNKNHIETI